MRIPCLICCIVLAACHHNTYPDCTLEPANGAAIAWERAPGDGLEGRVVDIDGNPIRTALVTLTGTPYGRQTDSAGRFEIPSLRPGTYNVVVRQIGYGRLERLITLGPGAGVVLTAVLERQPLKLTDSCGFAIGVARPWWKFW